MSQAVIDQMLDAARAELYRPPVPWWVAEVKAGRTRHVIQQAMQDARLPAGDALTDGICEAYAETGLLSAHAARGSDGYAKLVEDLRRLRRAYRVRAEPMHSWPKR